MADAGLLPHQATALANKWNEHVASMQSTMTAKQQQDATDKAAAAEVKNKAEETSLRTEWGQAHEANIGAARQAVTQFLAPFAPSGDSGAVIGALESALGYAATIKMLHAIGKGLGTGKMHGLDAASTGAVEHKQATLQYKPIG
jgi:hypothetical protein